MRRPIVLLLLVAAACRTDPPRLPAGREKPDPCAGQTCSGAGTCVAGPDGASCSCDVGFVADGLACVPEEDPCEHGCPDPCTRVDCGPNASCSSESGEAVCTCLPGYEREGGACVAPPCPVLGGGADALHAPSVALRVAVSTPAGLLRSPATLLFAAADGDDRFRLPVPAGGEAGEVRVAPGTYLVSYLGSGVSEPRNERHALGAWTIEEDSRLELSVPLGHVELRLRRDGAPLENAATLRLSTPQGDGLTIAVPAGGDGDRVPVVPGTYRVVLARTPGAEPWNESLALGTVQVDGDAAATFDVPLVRARVRVTAAGMPLASAARLTFESVPSGDRVAVQVLPDGTAVGSPDGRVPIAPGTYRVLYRRGSSPADPWNERHALGTFELRDDAEIEVDVPVVALPLQLTSNGGPLAAGATLALESATGDRFTVDVGADGAATVPVVPGEYRVFYRVSAARLDPWNERRLLGTVTADGSPVELDVVSVPVDVRVTSDGTPLAGSATLRLQTPAGDDLVLVRLGPGGAPEVGRPVAIAPGEYLVHLQEGGLHAGEDPWNQHHPLGTVRIDGASSLSFDVPSSPARARVFALGAGARDAFLHLERVGGDRLSADVVDGAAELVAVPGEYRVYLQHRPGAPANVPLNEHLFLGCRTVP